MESVPQSFGKIGEYYLPAWNRLGQARDRVFKLHGYKIIDYVEGAFIEYKQARTELNVI